MLENIRELCAANGMNLLDLEKACGLGTRTIYRWDENSPSVDKVKKVADHFGVTVDRIINGPDPTSEVAG